MTALIHIARKPTRLAVLIGAFVAHPSPPAQNTASVAANTAAQPASPTDSVNSKDTMTVIAKSEDNFRAGGDQLVPAYLDGQIANGDVLVSSVSKTPAMCRSMSSATPAECVTRRIFSRRVTYHFAYKITSKSTFFALCRMVRGVSYMAYSRESPPSVAGGKM